MDEDEAIDEAIKELCTDLATYFKYQIGEHVQSMNGQIKFVIVGRYCFVDGDPTPFWYIASSEAYMNSSGPVIMRHHLNELELMPIEATKETETK